MLALVCFNDNGNDGAKFVHPGNLCADSQDFIFSALFANGAAKVTTGKDLRGFQIILIA